MAGENGGDRKTLKHFEVTEFVVIFVLKLTVRGYFPMKITLNNEPLIIEGESITVEKLLEIKKYTFRMRTVKINGRIIDRERYDAEVIGDGDDVKVIYLMSGG